MKDQVSRKELELAITRQFRSISDLYAYFRKPCRKMSDNFQVNASSKGWNDAPIAVIKHRDKNNITEEEKAEILELIKNEPDLKELGTLIKDGQIEETAVMLIYDYLKTGSKTHYHKLITAYFEKYRFIPGLRKVLKKQ
eukprot:NODE_129_length_18551_cov_0.317039.p10 type:complete len:139 gc:universal NODE_129_length_18551_cov_0.317039:7606-7190(-)